MDTGRFDHMWRIARVMAQSSLLPKHLRGTCLDDATANCFRVVDQAVRWGMDPFAMIDETYEVHGRMGYQGKLVAAVINTRANLVRRLECKYSGQGDGRTIEIIGQFQGEDQPRSVQVVLSQARTTNDIWKKDPDQKLWYSGVIKWARRHCPELILGVATEDDASPVSEPAKQLPTGRVSFAPTPAQIKKEPAKLAEGEIIEPAPAPADTEQLGILRGQIIRLKLTQAEVSKLIEPHQVKRIDKLTEAQAQSLIDNLADLPTPN